jgi:hypothetical protein
MLLFNYCRWVFPLMFALFNVFYWILADYLLPWVMIF